MSIRLDTVSVAMVLLVTFIGWVVVRYAATYLDGDARQGAFTGWLSLTLASVMLLVTAGNLVQLVIAWIATFGVGAIIIALAMTMAAQGQSVFKVMLTFNTIMSLAYGPPALLGLVVKRTPYWSGLASFGAALVLERRRLGVDRLVVGRMGSQQMRPERDQAGLERRLRLAGSGHERDEDVFGHDCHV